MNAFGISLSYKDASKDLKIKRKFDQFKKDFEV